MVGCYRPRWSKLEIGGHDASFSEQRRRVSGCGRGLGSRRFAPAESGFQVKPAKRSAWLALCRRQVQPLDDRSQGDVSRVFDNPEANEPGQEAPFSIRTG